ncbi:nuclear transport factor 2 family protein [Ruicaihuangia caeni]|uniref:nuclear transport factor 2 family protein n=1 Tax=Ruicaihuangia caeni TaxID=3042517 RepID=UPI00338DB321
MNTPTYAQEHAAIVETVGKYIAGGTQADSALMQPAFSEHAIMYSAKDGELAGGPIARLFDTVDNRFVASPDALAAVTSVDIVGNAASVRLDIDGLSGSRFTDFFHLLKVEGEWKIISKIFHAHPAA